MAGEELAEEELGQEQEQEPAEVEGECTDDFVRDGNACVGWIAATPLPIAIAQHSATRLPDGRVLVAGGRTLDGAVDTTWLYDALADTWTAGPPLPEAKANHTALPLADGRVLLIGGETTPGEQAASVAIYSAEDNRWSSAAPLPTGRARLTATLLEDGRVLVAGGVQGAAPTNGGLLFDAVANTWTPTGAMAQPRAFHAAARLPDGRVAVLGGSELPTECFVNQIEPIRATATVELFDPASATFGPGPAMNQARCGHEAAALDGRVWVVGSAREVEVLEGNVWTTVFDTPERVIELTLTVVQQRLVIAGGGSSTGPSSLGSNGSLILDTTRAQLTSAPELEGTHTLHASVLLDDGSVLLTGGNAFSPALGIVAPTARTQRLVTRAPIP